MEKTGTYVANTDPVVATLTIYPPVTALMDGPAASVVRSHISINIILPLLLPFYPFAPILFHLIRGVPTIQPPTQEGWPKRKRPGGSKKHSHIFQIWAINRY
jgi:hypothetical protein